MWLSFFRCERKKDALDLKLTVDAKIQAVIERELNQAELKYDPDGAMAIAMNPNTGEVLGMSSRPTFNPEKPKKTDSKIYDHNPPVWKTFEPGSTFKVITLASALNEDVVDLKHDHFNDPGYVMVNGTKIKSWKKGGHGRQTFLEGVQNSSNPGFVKLGQRLGKQKLLSYIDQFGFGEKTGIDLPGEGTGILFKPEQVGPVELATMSFGQGVSVTPIQQVMAVSAAINGGYLYEPYIGKAWVEPHSGDVVKRNTPKLKRRVISEDTSKEVRNALESVVAKGTGGKAYIDGYRVGGKPAPRKRLKMENISKITISCLSWLLRQLMIHNSSFMSRSITRKIRFNFAARPLPRFHRTLWLTACRSWMLISESIN